MDDEGHENHGPIRSSSTGSHESPSSSSFFKPNNNNGNANAKEQDRFLPIANVGRIMKKVIPGNGKISKEARETVQVCVSEFISFVTGEASDKCQREKRKTINGDDIIWAITTLGFEDYVNPLKLYLTKYREIEDDKPTTTTNAVVVAKQEQQQSSSDYQHQHQNQSQPGPHHHHPLIDQTAIMCANAGGLPPPFLHPPPPTVYSSSHTHQHPSPPPPPPFVGSAPLMSLPDFLPSNSLQKTYHQHPEQIDSVGW